MPSGPHSRARLLGEVVDGGLGHGVGEYLRQRPPAGLGSHVDDAGANALGGGPLDEVAAESLARPYHAGRDGGHDGFEFLVTDLEEWRGPVEARRVHQDVDRTFDPHHVVHKLVELLTSCRVAGDEAATAQEIDCLRSSSRVAPGDDDVGARTS